jgi:hypothetical protein
MLPSSSSKFSFSLKNYCSAWLNFAFRAPIQIIASVFLSPTLKVGVIGLKPFAIAQRNLTSPSIFSILCSSRSGAVAPNCPCRLLAVEFSSISMRFRAKLSSSSALGIFFASASASFDMESKLEAATNFAADTSVCALSRSVPVGSDPDLLLEVKFLMPVMIAVAGFVDTSTGCSKFEYPKNPMSLDSSEVSFSMKRECTSCRLVLFGLPERASKAILSSSLLSWNWTKLVTVRFWCPTEWKNSHRLPILAFQVRKISIL